MYAAYTASYTHNRPSQRQYNSHSAPSDILFAWFFRSGFYHFQPWFASFLKENSSKYFIGPFCCKKCDCPLKKLSVFNLFEFAFSLTYSLWPGGLCYFGSFTLATMLCSFFLRSVFLPSALATAKGLDSYLRRGQDPDNQQRYIYSMSGSWQPLGVQTGAGQLPVVQLWWGLDSY
jgi:hypothetical protein